jgi:ribosomal protein L23
MPIPPLSLGSKLYFPNIIFKLVRSNLPPHQAVFHVPPQLSKLDIRQYLTKLYDISVCDVRTMNYAAVPKKFNGKNKVGGVPKYKKAIVTMEEDFVFPEIPTVKDNNAIKLPPRISFGRNSVRRQRKKINNQAEEMGISLDTKA